MSHHEPFLSRLKESLFFSWSGLKRHGMVGSVAPSSPWLTREICRRIDYPNARLVVEFGPGSGVFTREILKRLRPDARLVAFELNDEFVLRLQGRITDPRFTCVHAGAETAHAFLQSEGLGDADALVSGLPLAYCPEEARTAVLQGAVRLLKPGGTMSQFRYFANFGEEFSLYFPEFDMKKVPLNLPAAYVYHGKKA